MLETEALMFIALTVFVAGLVKGMTNLGLPAISLVLMMFAIDLK